MTFRAARIHSRPALALGEGVFSRQGGLRRTSEELPLA